MSTPDSEIIKQFAQSSQTDAQVLNSCCWELAQRYGHLIGSVIPWTDAVYRAQRQYPNMSQGQIAQRWLHLDDNKQLNVSLNAHHNIVVQEL